MNLETLFPVIIVAILTLLGNIIYFEYKFRKKRKEKSREVLRQRLTQFLLPLYVIFKKDELERHAWLNADVDMYEYESEMPKRIFSKEMHEIISKNLYLADDELHSSCLLFLEWAYRSNPDERYQRVHTEQLKEDKVFKRFRELVCAKFYQARREYLYS